jgi:hypothetical protein
LLSFHVSYVGIIAHALVYCSLSLSCLFHLECLYVYTSQQQSRMIPISPICLSCLSTRISCINDNSGRPLRLALVKIQSFRLYTPNNTLFFYNYNIVLLFAYCDVCCRFMSPMSASLRTLLFIARSRCHACFIWNACMCILHNNNHA